MKKGIVAVALFLACHMTYSDETFPAYSCKLLHEKGECADIVNDPLEKIVNCAEAGDMESQNLLSQMYYTGSEEVKINHSESFKWTRMSAEQDCPEAQRLLGHFYYYGLGVPPSQKNALHWWEKAAKNKEPFAMCQLAVMHLQEIHPNYDKAVAFRLMNEANVLYGQCRPQLAMSYYFGLGVGKDESKAIQMLKAEIQKGDPDAVQIYKQLGL